MRLFKTNKSQASLQSSHDTGRSQSLEQSPVESAAPTSPAQFPQHTAHAHAHQPLQTVQLDGAHDPPSYQPGPQYQRYDPGHPQPAHLPGRSQSQRISPTTYSNPTVKLLTPHQSGLSQAAIDEGEQLYPSPPLNNTAQFEDEPKKSKRGFFSLHSSSSGRDTSGGAAGGPQSPKALGRSISVRRRQAGASPLESQPNPNRFSVQDPSSELTSRPLREEVESPPPETAVPLNQRPPQYPQDSPELYQQTQQQDSRDRLSLTRTSTEPGNQQQYPPRPDSSQGQLSAQFRQSQDLQQPTPQSAQYNSIQSPPSNPSNTYNYPPPPSLQPKYNPQLDFHRRPPSQQSLGQSSLGPPSPINAQQPSDVQRQSQGSRDSQSNFNPLPIPQYQAQMPPSSQNVQIRGVDMNQQSTQGPPPRQDSMQAQGQHNHGGQYGQGPGPPPPSGNRHLQQNPSDPGRNSPQPKASREDSGGIDVTSLLQKHDELLAKYSKVKKYYFEKDAQVQQLQNTLAHQRLSLSRTSLDDNEYSTRFNRLDGAINNFAFNIRKEWKAIPPWLQGVVNRDAIAVGTKEMTAVGRACITRWLVEEILDRYFHPALEPSLSSQLKIIEKNVRRFSPPANTDEEKDAILAKLSNWRLTTLDGLQDMLASPQSAEYRASLTSMLVEKLTASLQMNLKDPPPPGIEGGVTMIVELAVGIAANLPQESRDVYVEYFLPGALINDTYMKIEGALPPLTNPGQGIPDMASLQQQQSDLSAADQNSIQSGGDSASLPDNASGKDAAMDLETELKDGNQSNAAPQGNQHPHKTSKRGMLSNLMTGGKKPSPQAPGPGSEKDSRSGSISTQSAQGQGVGKGALDKEEKDEERQRRIRFAAFVSVEVRGRGQVLWKAPVYTF